jgi:trimeric autotransporter adhesin
MKKLLLLLLIVPMISFGQNGVNYQGIISNSDGTVVASQSISVRFSVIYDSPNGTVAYSELHSPTTGANGLINLKVGTGTQLSSGAFSSVDWSTPYIYLKREIDIIGSGSYVDLGTDLIGQVPVALYAKNVNNININNNNTAIGINSMTTSTTSGQVNTAVGGNTLYSNSSGEGNTAIGYAALEDNTTGFTNVALGQNTLKENTTASQNVAVGYAAMRSNVTNGSLTAVGAYSLSSVIANTYGLTAIGYKSLENNTTGWNTTALGHMSLNSNTTGADNLALGVLTLNQILLDLQILL